MHFPLTIDAVVVKYLIHFLIGIAFGAVLEMSGFAISTRLAGQFYFKDQTVLKVMFGGVITAMVLIFWFVAMGWLDYDLIWVNPTYLWPGIVGGLIMGVGFIIGGFCPGTSFVSAATGKIDGLLFAAGVTAGVLLFGETEPLFHTWWYTSDYGRLTLFEVFHTSYGVMVAIVVIVALLMFWGAEYLERAFGGRASGIVPWAKYAFGLVALAAVALPLFGEPTVDELWARVAPEMEPKLQAREVYIHPAELMEARYDERFRTVVLDVRSEADYNLFHIRWAHRADMDDLPTWAQRIKKDERLTVVVLVSNDDQAATEAWKTLVALDVPNVYILDGGINHWLDIFAAEDTRIHPMSLTGGVEGERLRYDFDYALGEASPAADPVPDQHEELLEEFQPKIKLELPAGPAGGGCG